MSASDPLERDRASIRELVTRLYAALSGASDAERDWDALADAYHPSGCIAPGIFEDRPRGVLTPAAYLADARLRLGDRPFFEWEVVHDAAIGRNVASVRSEYAAAASPRGQPLIKAGVNHFLLTRTDAGWKVLAIAWD